LFFENGGTITLFAMFRKLWQRLKTEHRPKGLIEKFIVEQIATLFWKLGIVESLEVRELLRRQELSGDVDGIFHGNLDLPISGDDLPLDRGWDCERGRKVGCRQGPPLLQQLVWSRCRARPGSPSHQEFTKQ